MVYDLLGKIAGSDRHIGDSGPRQVPDIVVDDRHPADFQQRLGGLQRHRAQAFPFSSGHKDSRKRQHCIDAGKIEHPEQTPFPVQDG